HRDRLGRVRSPGDLPRQPAGRRGLQVRRLPHARGVDSRDPAARAADALPRLMRRITTAAVLAMLAALGARVALAVDPTVMPTPELQARYQALTHEFRCMQCQNEALADSPVSLAADLRAEVRDMLLAGRSDAEIRAFMVARYGDFILFRPRF